MSFNNIKYNENTIKDAWNTYSSIKIECSQPINIHGHCLTHHRIVFPTAGNEFPLVANISSNTYSYPICSCPSYYFKSYETQINGIITKGLCKHIHEILNTINIDVNIIILIILPLLFSHLILLIL